MPTLPPTKKETLFDREVKRLKAEGKYKGADDAKKRLRFIITPEHIRIAKRGNESECVVAQAIAEALPDNCVISVGECITKVLNLESCTIKRYATPANLKAGLKHFDETGQWDLPAGTYVLCKPTGNEQLTRNYNEKAKRLKADRWKRWQQKFEANGATGKGVNEHRSRPITNRQITILTKS